MNLQNRWSAQQLKDNKKQVRKVFFYRVCGTGMGACACLLKEFGLEVHGADTNFYPPMSDYLNSTDISLHSMDKIKLEFLQDFDLIIVGNSIPRMSEHARLIEDSGTPFTSFPEALGAFVLKDKTVIGIAGTHGKTTTAYFMTQLLENLGQEPGYFIGGVIDGRTPSSIGKGRYFVIESDEYDSAYFSKIAKFRHYEINKLILTSLEFDHADIYENVEQIEKEFLSIKDSVDYTIADASYQSVQKIKPEFKNDFFTYNDEGGPQFLTSSSDSSGFSFMHSGKEFSFSTQVVGRHNILNITACLKMLLEEGFSYDQLKDAVLRLGLVKRRQELRGEYRGAKVIDDFAHHPRAIKLTIQAIRQKYPHDKIITVYEPISATARSNYFQKDYEQCFEGSDHVILAKNKLNTTAKGQQNLDTNDLASKLKADLCPSLNDLRSKIDDYAKEGNVLLILSNRSCLGLWESDFVQAIN